MITIKIGASEKRFDSIRLLEEEWISRNIIGLQRDGRTVCIRISINEGPVNMTVVTSECQRTSSGGRPPNDEERKIFEIWEGLGLDTNGIEAGKIIAFLKRSRSLID